MARCWTRKGQSTTKEGDEVLKTGCLTLYYGFYDSSSIFYAFPTDRGFHSSHISSSVVSQLFYQLSTSQNNFMLNLTLQGGLLSPQFRVEYWKKGQLAWSHPYSPHCHYAGHLQDQPLSSKVALSNCNGLVRLTPCCCSYSTADTADSGSETLDSYFKAWHSNRPQSSCELKTLNHCAVVFQFGSVQTGLERSILKEAFLWSLGFTPTNKWPNTERDVVPAIVDLQVEHLKKPPDLVTVSFCYFFLC